MWVLSLLKSRNAWFIFFVVIVLVIATWLHHKKVTEFRQSIDNEYAARDKEYLEHEIRKARLQWLADGDNIVYVDKIITKYKTKVKYEKIEVPSECVGYRDSINSLLDAHIIAANAAIKSNR